jgi:ATP-dependent Clp protease ATP-binding subunit ClpA
MNDRDRFDKFTERARKVLSLAQEEAQRFQHNYIGTEHLLLGLVSEGEGVAARVLSNLGVELYQVRNSVEFIIGRGDRIVLGEIGLTPRAKKVIELAVDEARRLNHHYIGTEHLLLGLVREGEGIAAGVLESLGVNLEKVRTQTIQVLSQSGVISAFEETRTESVKETRTGSAPALMIELVKETQNALETEMQEKVEALDIFTVQLLRVLSRSQQEAQHFKQNYIGTEHLLLALIQETKGVAAKVLSNLDVDTSRVGAVVEFSIGRQNRIILIGFTPRAKKAIEFAKDEAKSMKHHYVGIEHLLLGLMREGEAISAGVLEQMGLTLEKVRSETMKVLDV